MKGDEKLGFRNWRCADADSSLGERWVMAAVGLLVLLNVLDAACTAIWVDLGVAREANILLRPILDHSVFLFVLVKMSIVIAALAVLWKHRGRTLAVAGLGFSCLAYACLTVWHGYIGFLVIYSL